MTTAVIDTGPLRVMEFNDEERSASSAATKTTEKGCQGIDNAVPVSLVAVPARPTPVT